MEDSNGVKPQPVLYFDYNATTPLDPKVAEAMAEILKQGMKPKTPVNPKSCFGNPVQFFILVYL